MKKSMSATTLMNLVILAIFQALFNIIVTLLIPSEITSGITALVTVMGFFVINFAPWVALDKYMKRATPIINFPIKDKNINE